MKNYEVKFKSTKKYDVDTVRTCQVSFMKLLDVESVIHKNFGKEIEIISKEKY